MSSLSKKEKENEKEIKKTNMLIIESNEAESSKGVSKIEHSVENTFQMSVHPFVKDLPIGVRWVFLATQLHHPRAPVLDFFGCSEDRLEVQIFKSVTNGL